MPPIDFEGRLLPGELFGAFGALGTDPGQFCDPIGLALDTSTNKLYVADAGNHRIQVLDCTDPRALRPLAVWDDAHFARIDPEDDLGGCFLHQPHALALHTPSARLFVADTFNHRILALGAQRGDIQLQIGSRGARPGQLHFPAGLTLWRDWLLVADALGRVQAFDVHDGHFVRVIAGATQAASASMGMAKPALRFATTPTASATPTANATSAPSSPPSAALPPLGQLGRPFFLCVFEDRLFVGEYTHHRVSVIDLLTCAPLRLLCEESPARFVTGLAVDPKTRLLYVGREISHTGLFPCLLISETRRGIF